MISGIVQTYETDYQLSAFIVPSILYYYRHLDILISCLFAWTESRFIMERQLFDKIPLLAIIICPT